MPGNKSRSENVKLNITVGVVAQIITLLMSFISRRLFVQFLSIEYLGINGLYSNILSLLSLAELGLGSVVTFSLYKPVADNDQPLIRALVRYFKKVYLVIALVISGVGIVLIPFLKYIVNSDLSESELIIYYVLFLINSVISYFVAHKVALLAANQDNRTQRLVGLFTAFIQQIIYIAILVLYPNYIAYVASTIAVSLIGNIILNAITNKKYEFLYQMDEQLVDFDKKSIIGNIKSTALYKLSTVLINSTDNILISILVSTTAIGFYSNYYMVVSALQGFIVVITSAISNSVGNLNAQNNEKRMLQVFKILVLFYHFIACYCAISMFYIFNDFISIWLGTNYLMNSYIVFAIAFNFYLTNLLTPIWSFRESTGQFVKAKYIMLVAALLNIVLSIALGIPFSVFGILIATAISKILTQVWYEPRILFRNVFHASQKAYWLQQLKNIVCTAICAVFCTLIANALSNGIVSIIIKGIVFFLVCLMVFMLFNYKSEEIKNIKQLITNRGNRHV